MFVSSFFCFVYIGYQIDLLILLDNRDVNNPRFTSNFESLKHEIRANI